MTTSKTTMLKRLVWKRDNYICQYCGKDLSDNMINWRLRKPDSEITVDHVVPKFHGGQLTMENLVTSCGPCNIKKGNKLQAPAK